MSQMGFGNRSRFWIRGCLVSSRASVLINSASTKEFPISKGVHQRDTLSPFLFIIALEGLNVVINLLSRPLSSAGYNFPITTLLFHTYSTQMMQYLSMIGPSPTLRIWQELYDAFMLPRD